MGEISIQPKHPITSSVIQHSEKQKLLSIEVFIFILGTLSSFYLDAIGQLYVTEVILVLLFPFLWVRNRGMLLKDRFTGRILLFGFIWFIGQALTDLIRATTTEDLLRGWAAIIVFLISFCAL